MKPSAGAHAPVQRRANARDPIPLSLQIEDPPPRVAGRFNDRSSDREYYKSTGLQEDDYQFHFNEDYFFNHRIREIVKAWTGRGRISLLDVGCGNGVLLDQIRRIQPEASLFGTDLAKIRLRLAGERLPAAHFFSSDAGCLPCAGWSFDGIFLTEVIEHMPDPGPALAEACRTVRAGGTLVLSVPSLDWYRCLRILARLKVRYLDEREHFREYGWIAMGRFVSFSELVRPIEAGGFRLKTRRGVCFLLPLVLFKRPLNRLTTGKRRILFLIHALDSLLGRIPGIRNFGLYHLFIFVKEK
ncbi:methyltransferase domain-containing protein [bacterium]|nr:methyltransferase domain-containing protein [bacterium]